MPLLQILTDPQNFKFYQGGQGYTSNDGTFGQKSIKYGNDRFNSANSGQPYVTVGIPGDYSQGNKTRIENYIGTKDFLLRGGATTPITSIIKSFDDIKNIQGINSANDVYRLYKMFNDDKSPSGLFFITKQQLLSRSAVRTQASGLLNGGFYNPLNTLAQAGIVAYGGHLNKQGINPFGGTGAYSDNDNLYFNVVKPNPNEPGESTANNRLVELLRLTSNKLPGNRKNGVTLNNGTDVMTYTGGPGSFLGTIGNTNIRYARSSQTFLLNNPGDIITKTSDVLIQSPFYFGANSCFVYSTEQIFNPYTTLGNPKGISSASSTGAKVSSQNIQQNHSSPKIQDFRNIIREQLKRNRLSTDVTNQPFGAAYAAAGNSGALPDNTFSSANTTNYISYQNDPGQRANKSYANYVKGVTNPSTKKSIYGGYTIGMGLNRDSFFPGLDTINSVPVYRSEEASNDLPDYVRFRIAIIDNDAPNFKTFIHFRAFLDSMSDSYTADWTPFKYLGRGENFYNYQGFSRQLSLSWTIAAQSKEELIPMYKKLNYLASSLTPDYSPTGYMRGNLVQLTIGGYLYEQPGIITSLTYDVPEESPWETASDINGFIGDDGTVKQLPHIIKVTGFNFIPIQKFRPGKQELTFNTNETQTTEDDTGFVRTYGPQQYISLADARGNNYETDNTNPSPSRENNVNNNLPAFSTNPIL